MVLKAKPSLSPAFLALLVFILFGILLFADLNPSTTQHTIEPPIDIINTPPLTIIEQDAEPISQDQITEQEAKAFIDILAQAQDGTIAINENQFVRHDSIIALPNLDIQQLSIKEIIQAGDMPDNALFYLHQVTEADQQGLWGIVQAGLIDKFREGVHLEGIALNKDSVQAIIPADADEKLLSGLSSFLGKILNQKVNSSYVYNLNTQSMGHDPNMIYPGQQLILIHFSPAELTDIYQFFSAKRNQYIETFGIND